jgi:hypothetical protein
VRSAGSRSSVCWTASVDPSGSEKNAASSPTPAGRPRTSAHEVLHRSRVRRARPHEDEPEHLHAQAVAAPETTQPAAPYEEPPRSAPAPWSTRRDRRQQHRVHLERRRQRALLAGRHQPVARHDDHGPRLRQGPDPRAAVEAAELAARLGQVHGAATGQLRRDPVALPRGRAREPHAGAPGALREQPQDQAQAAHEVPEGLLARVAPVQRRRAEHERGDRRRVPAREQLRHRPAHRVADHQRGWQPQRRQHPSRVVGAVRQPERRGRAQAAAVPAQVHRQHPVAGALQGRVDVQPVEVRREHPPVDQQHRLAAAAAVADEELPAPRHQHGAAGGQRERWHGRRRVSVRTSRHPHSLTTRDPSTQPTSSQT